MQKTIVGLIVALVGVVCNLLKVDVDAQLISDLGVQLGTAITAVGVLWATTRQIYVKIKERK